MIKGSQEHTGHGGALRSEMAYSLFASILPVKPPLHTAVDCDPILDRTAQRGSCPTSAEALHGAARYCRNMSLHDRGYEFAAQGGSYPSAAAGHAPDLTIISIV